MLHRQIKFDLLLPVLQQQIKQCNVLSLHHLLHVQNFNSGAGDKCKTAVRMEAGPHVTTLLEARVRELWLLAMHGFEKLGRLSVGALLHRFDILEMLFSSFYFVKDCLVSNTPGASFLGLFRHIVGLSLGNINELRLVELVFDLALLLSWHKISVSPDDRFIE